MTVRRGTTLVEILIATVVATLVAASVGSLMTMLAGAISEQDRLGEQLVRTAGSQARIADHILRARCILHLSSTQMLLWVPAETFEDSNVFKDAYDTINTNELRWYTWDPTLKAVVCSRRSDSSDTSPCALSTNWAALYSTLKEANKLSSTSVIDGLSSASFLATGFDPCATRRVNLDLAFDATHGGQAFRISEAVQFLQKHKDCP